MYANFANYCCIFNGFFYAIKESATYCANGKKGVRAHENLYCAKKKISNKNVILVH